MPVCMLCGTCGLVEEVVWALPGVLALCEALWTPETSVGEQHRHWNLVGQSTVSFITVCTDKGKVKIGWKGNSSG